MMSSTNVRVIRQTNTNSSLSRSQLLVINTSYITSRLGLLKLLLLSLSLFCLILILVETQKAACAKGDRRYTDGASCYKIYTGDLFLLLINFCHLHIVFLMLITSLLSSGNASLMPKTNFDHIFHYVGFGLYLIGGLWVLIDSIADGRTAIVIIASLFAILCSFCHLIHGLISYQKSTLV